MLVVDPSRAESGERGREHSRRQITAKCAPRHMVDEVNFLAMPKSILK